MSLRATLSSYWFAFQVQLFPLIEQDLGPVGQRYQSFTAVLAFVRPEQCLHPCGPRRGRPLKDRAALARAFIAKAVFQLATTRELLERLANDRPLRRLCGWQSRRALPSESTFSRSFTEFAQSALPSRLHQSLIERTMGDHLVGHVSRDSTAIAARERANPQPKPAKQPRKRGRPRKGEQRPPQQPRRLTQQPHQSLSQMLADLPQACEVGTKRNAKGRQESWVGYKLHLDAADGGVPLSCILTSASLHDSQAAIPLAAMTASRVNNLYDLMDSAYDAAAIRAYSESLGHVPIIDRNPRRDAALKQHLKQEARVRRELGMIAPEQQRYRERGTVERVHGRVKDEFGGRQVRVRGHAKVLCHLMFGILALTVVQLLRLLA